MSREVNVSITRRDPPASPMRSKLARAYLRGVIARCITDDPDELFSTVQQRWPDQSEMILKSGVPASGNADLADLAAHDPRAAFFQSVLEASIVGRLDQARRVGFNVRTLTPGSNATGYWVGEKKPIPLSRVTLDGGFLPSRKVAGLVICTNESLRDPASENSVITDIERACTGVLDQALVSDDAGDSDTPAGVLDDVTPIPSSGDPADDAAAAIEAFEGDLSTAVWVSDPTTIAQAALTGGQAFANVGATGGSLLGVPVLTSRSSPRDSDGGQLVLLDQQALALAFEGIDLTRSRSASVEADDDPQGDGGGPTASSANVIHLFQAELTALKLVIAGNWSLQRDGAVSVVTGATYTGSS